MPTTPPKTKPQSQLEEQQQLSPEEWRLRREVLTFVLHYLSRVSPGRWDVQVLTENAHGLFYTPWTPTQTLNILKYTVALPADAPLSEKPVEQRQHGRVYVRDGVPTITFAPLGVFLWQHPSPSDMVPFLCGVIQLFPRNRAANLLVLAKAARRCLPPEVQWTESAIVTALKGTPTMPGLVLENPEKVPINTRIQMGKPFRRWIHDVVELADERYHENADACHFYFRDIAHLERFEVKVQAPWDTRDDDRGVVWMQASFVLERREVDRQVSARVTMPNRIGSYNLSRTLTRETPYGLVFLYTTEPRTTLPLWGLWMCLRGRVREEGVHARVVLCMSGLIRIFECPFTGAKLYVLHGQASKDIYKARASPTVNPHLQLHEHTQTSWTALAGQTYEPGTQLEGEVGQPCHPRGVLLGHPSRNPHFELHQRCHFFYYDPVLTEEAPLPLSCPFTPTTMSTDTGHQVVKDLTLVNTHHSTTHLALVCQWTARASRPDIRMGLLFRMKRPQAPQTWELQCMLPEPGEGYTVGKGKLLAARNLFPYTALLCLFMVEATVSQMDRRRYLESLVALALEGVCPPLAMIQPLEEEVNHEHHHGATVFEPDALDLGMSCLMERFPTQYEIVAGAYFELMPLLPWLTTTATNAHARSVGANIHATATKLVNLDLYVEHLSVTSFRLHGQGYVYLLDPSPRTFLAKPATLHQRKTLVFYLQELGLVNAEGRRRPLSTDAAYDLAQRFERLCMCCAVACTSSSEMEMCQDTEMAFVEAVLPLEFLKELATEAPRLYHEFLWCLDRPGLLHQVLFASEGTVFATFFTRFWRELRQHAAAVRAVKRQLEDGAHEAESTAVVRHHRPRPMSRSRSL